ncbi:hypothetical protein ACIQU4_16040 [Streptomyces sp. NPDC090741]|uniref:hypothetical protein n=1 Tax=Streptomyces sp. NPDC090741 TaxID=3365967 RepID=UPI00380C46C8
MRIRPVLAVASVFLAATVVGAPAAMASGNAGQYWSVTELTFGKFNTMIGPQNDGSGYWWMEESYGKAGGGTITAQYGFNYHGYSYNKGWFTQSAGDAPNRGDTSCASVRLSWPWRDLWWRWASPSPPPRPQGTWITASR